jgi:hypothetical protein
MPKKWHDIGKLIAWAACVFGGFASFLTWLGIKPKDLAMSQSIPIPHVLWLLLAITLFAIGIGSSTWSGILQQQGIKQIQERLKESAARNLQYRSQIEALNARYQELEASQKEELENSQEAYRQCMLERSAAMHGAEECLEKLAMFSPLQIETLQLAKELNGLLKAYPLPKKTDYGYNRKRQSFETEDQIHAWGDARSAIEQKVRAKYALDFRSKATQLYHRLVTKANIDDRNLEALVKGEAKTEEIENLIIALRKVAFTIEDSQP